MSPTPTPAQESAAQKLYWGHAGYADSRPLINAIAALIAERDAARAERNEAVKLLRRADDLCQLLKPPASDRYTNGLEPDIQQFFAAPPSPEPAKEPT